MSSLKTKTSVFADGCRKVGEDREKPEAGLAPFPSVNTQSSLDVHPSRKYKKGPCCQPRVSVGLVEGKATFLSPPCGCSSMGMMRIMTTTNKMNRDTLGREASLSFWVGQASTIRWTCHSAGKRKRESWGRYGTRSLFPA